MAEYVNAFGKVVKGDFAGCYVWCWNHNLYLVVSDGPNFSGMHCSGPTFKIGFFGAHFGTTEQWVSFLQSNKKYEITPPMVENVVEAASYQTSPSASAFVNGALTAGVGYGMAKAMASVQSSESVAVYMKDGKKMLIEFYTPKNAATFKNDMFVF